MGQLVERGIMKVGVLGSGVVAKTLGIGFLQDGHDVTMGTRDPARLAEWSLQNPRARIASFAQAAESGELIVLAVKGTAAREVLAAAASHMEGKTVIDTTNPFSDAPPVHGVLQFFTPANESLMERLQREFPKVRLVKAFNSVGNACMVHPQLTGGKPTMFICGDDDVAKRTVTEVLVRFGWEVADMGKAEAARPIESLAILWCIPGFLQNQWRHAFKLMK